MSQEITISLTVEEARIVAGILVHVTKRNSPQELTIAGVLIKMGEELKKQGLSLIENFSSRI